METTLLFFTQLISLEVPWRCRSLQSERFTPQLPAIPELVELVKPFDPHAYRRQNTLFWSQNNWLLLARGMARNLYPLAETGEDVFAPRVRVTLIPFVLGNPGRISAHIDHQTKTNDVALTWKLAECLRVSPPGDNLWRRKMFLNCLRSKPLAFIWI